MIIRFRRPDRPGLPADIVMLESDAVPRIGETIMCDQHAFVVEDVSWQIELSDDRSVQDKLKFVQLSVIAKEIS